MSYINQCLGIGDALEQGCPPDSFTWQDQRSWVQKAQMCVHGVREAECRGHRCVSTGSERHQQAESELSLELSVPRLIWAGHFQMMVWVGTHSPFVTHVHSSPGDTMVYSRLDNCNFKCWGRGQILCRTSQIFQEPPEAGVSKLSEEPWVLRDQWK